MGLLCMDCAARLLTQPRATSPGMAPPTSIINQKMPTYMPTGQSDEGSSSVEVPSSQATLVCVKLTK